MTELVSIVVPSFGESVQVATLAEVLIKEGQVVQKGDALVLFQSEKATSEIYAPASGKVHYTANLTVGAEFAIGAVLGTIDPSVAVEPKKMAAPSVEKKEKSVQTNPVKESLPEIKDPIKESNLAWLKAEEKKQEAPAPSIKEKETQGVVCSPMSPLRKAIAKRLVEAKQKSAMLTTFNEVDMSAILGLRQKYKESFEAKHGIKLGMMSFFVKAVVHALEKVPAVNGWIEGDQICISKEAHIAVAVSTEKGLMVPVVRNCEKLSFAEIEGGIVALSKKARDGKIALADLTGGTFTITNGGVFGSLLSTPIINPPQSAILGMHTIQKRAVVIQDKIEIRPMMYLAMSYDHRLIDGKEAVTFLVAVKEFLEDPSKMLLDL